MLTRLSIPYVVEEDDTSTRSCEFARYKLTGNTLIAQGLKL